MEPITILVIDDHAMVRQSLTLLLNSVPDFKVIASAESGEEAVEIARQMNPDIALIDINLPGMNGIQAAELIKKYSPRTKSLGLSLHAEAAYVSQMLKNGARGYITKNSSREEMIKAITEIHHNRQYICDEVKTNLSQPAREENNKQNNPGHLSETEKCIIEFIKKGLSSKEIAGIEGLSTKIIDSCRNKIMKKLNLKSVASLLNYVHNN